MLFAKSMAQPKEDIEQAAGKGKAQAGEGSVNFRQVGGEREAYGGR